MKYPIILLIVLSSCFNEKPYIQPDLSLKQKNRILRHDGIYTMYDTLMGFDSVPLNLMATFIKPMRFFENNCFFHSSSCYLEEQEFQNYFKRDCYQKRSFRNQGYYYIIKDSLYLSGKFTFYWIGKIPKFYIAHFRGYIKNADTITDWKMIPPYPNIDFQSNFYELNRNQPATYIFKPLKFDSIIDPEKLWIIEEQKKQDRSKSTIK